MENKKFIFYNQCPKCDKTSELDVLKWHDACWSFKVGNEYITEPLGVIYFSFFCNACNQCISGHFPYGQENGTPRKLSEYNQGDGNISRFISHVYSEFIFDVRPLTRNNIFNEAETCYFANAFTATILLCRTVLDIESQKIWKEKFRDSSIPKLKVRLEKLFSTSDDRSEETKHYHITNLMRLDGNLAAHEITHITKEDAKKALEMTEYFINNVAQPYRI